MGRKCLVDRLELGLISVAERRQSQRSSKRCCLCWKSATVCWPEGKVSLTPRPLGLSICILPSLIFSLPLITSLSISAPLSSSLFHASFNDRIDRMQDLHGLIRAHTVPPHSLTWMKVWAWQQSPLWKEQRHQRSSTKKTLSGRWRNYHSIERWICECMTYLVTYLALAEAASFLGCLTSISQDRGQFSLISWGFAWGHLNRSIFKSRRLYWQWKSRREKSTHKHLTGCRRYNNTVIAVQLRHGHKTEERPWKEVCACETDSLFIAAIACARQCSVFCYITPASAARTV